MNKLILLALSSLTIIVACKKGENDPFFSLKSRTNRLVGEYDLTEWTTDRTFKLEDVQTGAYHSTFSINGGTIETTDFSGSNPITITESVAMQKAYFEFKKDGTWHYVLAYESSYSEEINFGLVERFDYLETVYQFCEGKWDFAHREPGDSKNKERLMLSSVHNQGEKASFRTKVFTDGTSLREPMDSIQFDYHYADGENPVIYSLDRLAKNETIMTREQDGKSNMGYIDEGGTTNMKVISTSKETIHITKK